MFKVNTLDIGSFKYLGLKLMLTNEDVQIHQNLYIPTSPINIDLHRHMNSLAKLTLKKKSWTKNVK